MSSSGAMSASQGRQRQRLDRPQRLAGDAERFPARRHDAHGRALAEHGVSERGRVGDEVLAVVEHEQRVLAGQRGDRAGRRPPSPSSPARCAGRTRARSRRPSAASTAGTMSAGSLTDANSTIQTPSARRVEAARAACTASRVLPAPPGPTRVVSRDVSRSVPSAAMSCSRPTKLVSGVAQVGQRRVRFGSARGRRTSARPSAGCGRARRRARPTARRPARRRAAHGPARTPSAPDRVSPVASSARISSTTNGSRSGAPATSPSSSETSGPIMPAAQVGVDPVAERAESQLLEPGAGGVGEIGVVGIDDRGSPPQRQGGPRASRAACSGDASSSDRPWPARRSNRRTSMASSARSRR